MNFGRIRIERRQITLASKLLHLAPMRNHHRREKFAVISENDRGLDHLALAEYLLDHRRRNFLACGEDNRIFRPSCYTEPSGGIQRAEIPCSKPAVADRGFGGIGIFVISLHDVWPSG